MGKLSLIVCFPIFFISLSFSQTINEHETTFLGAEVVTKCKSSYSPIWTWYGNNEIENLAVGATKHKKFQDKRYTFKKEGDVYSLTIENVKSSDAGRFVCDGETSHQFLLTVLGLPQCNPPKGSSPISVEEDEQRRFVCSANITDLTTDGTGEIVWKLGDTILQTNTEMLQSSMKSDYAYSAKHADQGKELTCSVKHRYLKSDAKIPSCSFGNFDVKFEPKFLCENEAYILGRSGDFSCEVEANPMPSKSSFFWKFGKEVKDAVVTPINSHKAKASIFAQRQHLDQIPASLSVRKPESSKILTKDLNVVFVHGPDIACPKRLPITVGKNGRARVNCDVYVSPPPPLKNISWHVEGNIAEWQRKELVTEMTGGVKLSFEFDPDQYQEHDPIDVMLKVKGYQNTGIKEIEVTIKGRELNDEERRREGKGGVAFDTKIVAILLGSCFVLTLLFLFAVGCMAFIRTRNNRNRNNYSDDVGTVISRGSDVEGLDDFTFLRSTNQQQKGIAPNPVNQSGTMTIRLMNNLKKASRTEDWTMGFAKMANALYLKDEDQDGYLTVAESRPVIISYSEIYDLGFDEEKIDESLAQCSNGHHVDVETFLHLLSKS